MELRGLLEWKLRHEKVIFTLTTRFNMFVMVATMSLFLILFFLLKDAFLLRFFALGLFVGTLYGIEWIRTIDHNWDFYREFYSPVKRTPIKKRIMMEPKNLLKMWWSTVGSVILGLTLAYINIESTFILSFAYMCGYTFSGAVMLYRWGKRRGF